MMTNLQISTNTCEITIATSLRLNQIFMMHSQTRNSNMVTWPNKKCLVTHR